MKTTPMRRVDDGILPGAPGEFSWDAGRTHLCVMLPNTTWANLPIRGRAPGPTTWSWDGNEDRPTLDPSILQYETATLGEGDERVTIPGWHGWIRAGVLEEC